MPGAGQMPEALLATIRPDFPEDCWPVVWLTGGTVRDTLLGKTGKDLDLAAFLPGAMLRSLGYREVTGRSTAPVWLRHDRVRGSMEVTLLDAADGIMADLQRRDFTMNAIALSLAGEILDPLGGRRDLELGLLEPCSDRTFLDDPLRVFRAFRFAAEGFSLSAATKSLLERAEWDRHLGGIPVERFSREMLKALAAPHPERFFALMIRFHAGRLFLPELFRLAEVPAGPAEHHPEGDLFSHSLDVMKRVCAVTDDPLARFCALFHDMGKLATPPALYPKHHGHEVAGFTAAPDFCRRLKLSAGHGRALAWVCRLHGMANRLGTLRPATAILMAQQAKKGGIVDILPLVSAADSPGGMDMELWGRLSEVASMTTRQLGIDNKRLQLVPEEDRGELILQRRVVMLRTLR